MTMTIVIATIERYEVVEIICFGMAILITVTDHNHDRRVEPDGL